MAITEVDIILIVTYGLVVIFGTIGNMLVIAWFGIGEKRKNPGSKLVVVLAINDFLASIFVPFLQINWIVSFSLNPQDAWYLGKTLCHSLYGIQLTFLVATPYLLIAISMERLR